MSNWNRWLCSSLLVLASVGTAIAGAKDTDDTKIAADPSASGAGNASLTPASGGTIVTALLGVLVMKGVLAPDEANAIQKAAPQAEFQLLVEALARKGVVSAVDLAVTNPVVATGSNPAPTVVVATVQPGTAQPTASPKPAAPKVIPAIAPLRVLQLEPSPVDGMIPDIKLGSGAKIKLYGLVKASVIYDSSSPYGTDTPMPGFINIPTTVGPTAFDPGPNGAPEFHAKARFFRLGTNFEWPDASQNTSITGKFEFDFEGNYTGFEPEHLYDPIESGIDPSRVRESRS